ncbi:hypothetical protein LSH36_58g11022 [Paralvinella palmiformis]|uniref:PAS domain-containing protein n=1 Tax=Paralvinella palmiformis TaxID=53620 RepID=A0AAD9K4L6_9ANNE|nr:hypothetical protein LSH36_58g11022 [Paralvinella palmiformis]
MNSFSLGGRDRKREEPTMNACINYDDLRLEDYSCSGQQQSVPNPGTNVTSTAKLNRLENRPGVYERYLAIMLLFGKEDAQSDGFLWAAERAGYRCNVVRSEADARDCYRNKPHDYVNPTFEKMFGFTSSEIIGKDIRELSNGDRKRPDINDDMVSYLKKGQTWEGVITSSRKSGDSLSHHCHVTPVLGQNGTTFPITNPASSPDPINKICLRPAYARTCTHAHTHTHTHSL